MKNVILSAVILGLIGLSGFKAPSPEYEQVAFTYFVSDILPRDFKEVTSLEFRGKTEESYSTLGGYKVCLKPAEKLQSIIAEASRTKRTDIKQISYDHLNNVAIAKLKQNSRNPTIYVYPAMHLADNFYVFIQLQMPNAAAARYLFELSPDGQISRSCRME
jgi:hypothetical protein